MEFIRKFKELDRHDIQVAGGKGANLGSLVKMGMPVPPGFVITAEGYEKFIEENNLREKIRELVSKRDEVGIRELFLASKIPEKLEQAVIRGFEDLGSRAVAVRSSATLEDMPEAAFAGQLDTSLNIQHKEALFDAIRRSWASLWTERVIAYRERLGLGENGKMKVAVVVQRMIDADFAGVLFTANPMTGDQREVVIDSNPGLGEAVVSGEVTPDHYILRKRWGGWQVREYKLGRREVVIRAKKGGGTERINTPDKKEHLPERVLAELAGLGKKIEKHFGQPQDIEWVWASGETYIVQSRPITALAAKPPKLNRISRMFSSIVAEVMPRRPYPFETIIPELLVEDFLKPFFRSVGFNLPPLKHLFVEEDGVPVRFTGDMKVRPTPYILLTPFRLALNAFRFDPKRWRGDPLVEESVEHIRKLEERDLSRLSLKELLEIIPESLKMFISMVEIRMRYFPRVALALLGVRLLLALAGRKDVFATLLFVGIQTKVTETNAELEKLAGKMRGGKNVDFQEQFAEFLNKYGHRETAGSMLISEPSWKESPETVLEILKTMSARPSQKEKTNWQELRDRVMQNSYLRLFPFKQLFISLLDIARLSHVLREDTRFYIMMTMPVIRRVVLEIGRRLKEKGSLKEVEDIFYLKLEEMKSIGEENLKALVARRKDKYKELAHIPFVDPGLYRRNVKGEGVLLSGTAGSPGVAEGPARIIRDSSEFGRLKPGDILVAPYTTPSWTPLFERAAGVVVDTGGVMSHAAIVSREYGIPAVMGTTNGTEKLSDGELIRVDGSSGTVSKTEKTKWKSF